VTRPGTGAPSPAAPAGLPREAGFEILEQAAQRQSVDPAMGDRAAALRSIALSALPQARIPERRLMGHPA
jgi:hypothetical protein